MLITNLFKKFKNKILLSIFFVTLIISASIYWQIKINDGRVLNWEPDDHLHFLNKTTSHKYCQNYEECYYKNLIGEFKELENKNIYEQWFYERQIHRLLLFYHPMYTFLLNKLSNYFNIFEAQNLLHLLLGIFQGLIIFYYLNYFVRQKLTIFLSILLISTHYYFKSWGIYYPNPWTISVLIASLALTTDKRLYVYPIMIIAGLFHKVGILIYILTFISKLIIHYINTKENKIKKIIVKYKFDFIITSILFLIIYFFDYSPFKDLDVSIYSVYNFNINYEYFASLIFDNIRNLFQGIKHLLVLSPLLFIFFIYAFSLKTNDHKIEKLKIFSLLLIFSSIFYFLPSGGKPFAFGVRSWHLITLNYVVLSVTALMYLYKGKYNFFFKILFISTLPIFLYWGILLNLNFSFIKLNKENYFLEKNFVENIINEIPKNEVVYLNTNESIFYFFMANGLIKKNFHYKSNLKSNSLDQFIIEHNPIMNSKRDSSFIVENSMNFKVINKESSYDKVYLKLNSKKNTVIKLNDKEININKGKNLILLSINTDYYFDQIVDTIYLTGLGIDNKQLLSWPWGNEIILEINTIENAKIDLKKINTYFFKTPPFNTYYHKFIFDFNKLPNFNNLCFISDIISDSGPVIVFKNNCT